MLFLAFLLDEVLHEVFFGVDLIVDDLVADAALAGTVGSVVELAHLLPLPLEEDFDLLLNVAVHALLREDLF